MVRYSYTKVVNTDKLEAEIKITGLPYCYLETVGVDKLYVWMNEELSSTQESILTSVVQNHTTSMTVSPAELIKQKIIAAMAFGRELIAEYGATNVLAGYSIEEIQEIMDKTARVQVALNTGSLYVALAELDAVEIDGSIITEEKMEIFRHKIQDYLQIPRT